MAARLEFRLRPESFAIHRLPPDRRLELARLQGTPWYSITRTEEELSVVAREDVDLGPGDREGGWSCLQIRGPLDFSLIGIVAGVATLLAEAQVSLFAVSTYDTDCFLVRTSDLETAVRALSAAGHRVSRR